MIGEIKFFLGLQIVQNKEGIFISQTKYLKDLLKRFGLEGCKPIGSPMVTGLKLSSKDETPIVEQKKYRSMIGVLQYLTHNRPDIANAIGIVARFQVDPREYHYVAVNRLFRYLKGTSDYGIQYDRGNDFTICTYTDADLVGDRDDRKSTNGGAFFLGLQIVQNKGIFISQTKCLKDLLKRF